VLVLEVLGALGLRVVRVEHLTVEPATAAPDEGAAG
jgi:hypothetical protein